ncbi:carotenoid cleavage dioxygenase 7, chloroplastic [Vitis riparia]|uniref:Carotenoid cleavage dioxygenase 7 n=1 Tax=Vitis riparia TaxID=96939 RepID=A0A286MU90_VITRI|nr:carotenoid cleavage dioxygenase 7, chloroplastic [Vitis riparia]ASW34032.1 carotenoid cleavage dioxygenase 7 [Vitis riparia]
MQAKPLHAVPVKFPSPTKLPLLQKPPAVPEKVLSRAISISTPDTRVSDVSTPNLDDSLVAFWDYQFLFMSQRSETDGSIALRVVDGAIPVDFPSGTYFLAGPGLFSDDHGSTVHPLDGHGYLRAFAINGPGKEVKFSARYVKTEAQLEEHDPMTRGWRFTYRGPFSVLKGGKKVGNRKVMKNVANTSVLKWGGRLMCLWEGGDPYEIESGTLDTIGRLDMMEGCDSLHEGGSPGGDAWDLAAAALKPILHGVFKMPEKRPLSHYKIDAKRNRLLMMWCNAEDMLLPRSNFTIYEFDSKMKVVQRKEFKIPDHLMIHDWAFTDSHYVLFSNRIKLDILGSMGALSGLSPMISALSANPSKPTSPIYLLPRFSDDVIGNRDWRVPIEVPSQLWLIHVGNAYEERDERGNFNIQIHASACSYHWFNFHKMFGYDWQSRKLDPCVMNVQQGQEESLPHLIQVSINLDANGTSKNCSVEPLNQWNKPSDFPAINPSSSGTKNTYMYAAAASGSRSTLPHFPFDTIVKVNVPNKSTHRWSTGTRRFIGEPIFVPKGIEEDDGYLLVVEYAVSIQRCYLVILDAKRIGEIDALVARLEVPKHLTFPIGFHGFWAPKE